MDGGGTVARAAATASAVELGGGGLRRVEPVRRGASRHPARRRPASSGTSWPRPDRRSTPSSLEGRAQRRHRTGRSDRRPTNATSPPSRPIVRAALNGPPPGTADSWPSGWTIRSMSASPATTITSRHPRGAAVPCDEWTALPMPSNYLDGTLDDPATLAGNLRDLRRVQPLARRGRPERRGDRGPGRPSRRAHDARRRNGRRRHPAGAPRARAVGAARRWPIVGLDSRPEVLAAAGHRHARTGDRRRARASTSATAARCPSPTARSTSSTASLRASITSSRPRRPRCSARWPASPGWAWSSTTSTAAGSGGWGRGSAATSAHRATGTPGTTRRCPSAARIDRVEMADLLRAAGPEPGPRSGTPRCASAMPSLRCTPTAATVTRTGPPDPIGAGE